MAEKTLYPNFNLIRLLLAAEVVFAHVLPAFFGLPWNGVIMAVPAFIAVSGFLVLHSYRHSVSNLRFARKRALRILPALVVSLAVSLLLLGQDYLLNSAVIWLTGGLVILGVGNSPLWSLMWEEVAYTFIVIFSTLKLYNQRRNIWALFLLALAVSYYVAHQGYGPYHVMLSYLPPSFLMGNLMYLHRDALLRLGAASPYLAWALLLLVVFWGWVPLDGMREGMAPVWLQAFSVVWVGMAGRKVPFEKMPDISYGLYVLHVPLLDFFQKIHPSAFGVMAVSLYFMALVVMGVASWYLVEKPALKFK